MKVNEYLVVSEAVEEGVNFGWMRAHKHIENPDEERIKSEIINAVMIQISEYFIFEDLKDD